MHHLVLGVGDHLCFVEEEQNDTLLYAADSEEVVITVQDQYLTG